MRCDMAKCIHNEDGYCECRNVSIDKYGTCNDYFIPISREGTDEEESK